MIVYPDYLVHPLYFPEPEYVFAWSNVSIGWRFASVPRIFNDCWSINLFVERYFA